MINNFYKNTDDTLELKLQTILFSLKVELGMLIPSLIRYLNIERPVSLFLFKNTDKKHPEMFVSNYLYKTALFLDEEVFLNDPNILLQKAAEVKYLLFKLSVTNTLRHFLFVTANGNLNDLNTEISFNPFANDKQYNLLFIALDIISEYATNLIVKSFKSTTLNTNSYNLDLDPEKLNILSQYSNFLELHLKPESNNLINLTGIFVKRFATKQDLYKTIFSKINRYKGNLEQMVAIPFDVTGSDYFDEAELDKQVGRGTESVYQVNDNYNIFNTISFFSELEKLLMKNNIQRNLFSKFISGYKFTIANAHVNFKNELDANLSTIIAEDLSLSKINKRYLYTNLILPSSVVNQLKLAIAIDHSGSISERESREQLGVIDNILEGRVGFEAELITFATEIRTTSHVDLGSSLESALPKLGEGIGSKGGTTFNCVFEHLKDHEQLEELNLIILISADGCGGDIELPQEFLERFNGKILFVFKNNNTGEASASRYQEDFSKLYPEVNFQTSLYNSLGD
ncbi:MAG: hypothetical protein [Bacteriophage sp.]|nr:MAG: hypothetical protein [Bacteriophage sp.]